MINFINDTNSYCYNTKFVLNFSKLSILFIFIAIFKISLISSNNKSLNIRNLQEFVDQCSSRECFFEDSNQCEYTTLGFYKGENGICTECTQETYCIDENICKAIPQNFSRNPINGICSPCQAGFCINESSQLCVETTENNVISTDNSCIEAFNDSICQENINYCRLNNKCVNKTFGFLKNTNTNNCIKCETCILEDGTCDKTYSIRKDENDLCDINCQSKINCLIPNINCYSIGDSLIRGEDGTCLNKEVDDNVVNCADVNYCIDDQGKCVNLSNNIQRSLTGECVIIEETLCTEKNYCLLENGLCIPTENEYVRNPEDGRCLKSNGKSCEDTISTKYCIDNLYNCIEVGIDILKKVVVTRNDEGFCEFNKITPQEEESIESTESSDTTETSESIETSESTESTESIIDNNEDNVYKCNNYYECLNKFNECIFLNIFIDKDKNNNCVLNNSDNYCNNIKYCLNYNYNCIIITPDTSRDENGFCDYCNLNNCFDKEDKKCIALVNTKNYRGELGLCSICNDSSKCLTQQNICIDIPFLNIKDKNTFNCIECEKSSCIINNRCSSLEENYLRNEDGTCDIDCLNKNHCKEDDKCVERLPNQEVDNNNNCIAIELCDSPSKCKDITNNECKEIPEDFYRNNDGICIQNCIDNNKCLLENNTCSELKNDNVIRDIDGYCVECSSINECVDNGECFEISPTKIKKSNGLCVICTVEQCYNSDTDECLPINNLTDRDSNGFCKTYNKCNFFERSLQTCDDEHESWFFENSKERCTKRSYKGCTKFGYKSKDECEKLCDPNYGKCSNNECKEIIIRESLIDTTKTIEDYVCRDIMIDESVNQKGICSSKNKYCEYDISIKNKDYHNIIENVTIIAKVRPIQKELNSSKNSRSYWKNKKKEKVNTESSDISNEMSKFNNHHNKNITHLINIKYYFNNYFNSKRVFYQAYHTDNTGNEYYGASKLYSSFDSEKPELDLNNEEVKYSCDLVDKLNSSYSCKFVVLAIDKCTNKNLDKFFTQKTIYLNGILNGSNILINNENEESTIISQSDEEVINEVTESSNISSKDSKIVESTSSSLSPVIEIKNKENTNSGFVDLYSFDPCENKNTCLISDDYFYEISLCEKNNCDKRSVTSIKPNKTIFAKVIIFNTIDNNNNNTKNSLVSTFKGKAVITKVSSMLYQNNDLPVSNVEPREVELKTQTQLDNNIIFTLEFNDYNLYLEDGKMQPNKKIKLLTYIDIKELVGVDKSSSTRTLQSSLNLDNAIITDPIIIRLDGNSLEIKIDKSLKRDLWQTNVVNNNNYIQANHIIIYSIISVITMLFIAMISSFVFNKFKKNSLNIQTLSKIIKDYNSQTHKYCDGSISV